MNNKLLVKIIGLVVLCLLSVPLADFISQNFGSITTDDYIISRIYQYGASIRGVCFIFLVYFIFAEKRKKIII